MTIIDAPGTYPISTGEAQLVISIDSADIVKMQLIDGASGQPRFVDHAGSNWSRWYLCFTDDSCVWIYSGDIGGCVWMPQADGTFQRRALVDDHDLIRKMPKAFFDKLPKTLQRSWASIRMQE